MNEALEVGDKTVVLLGAGASVEAGIPDAFEMTDRLGEALARSGGRSAALTSAYEFAVRVLREDSTQPRTLDVERVFTAIQLLAKRESIEIAPFISRWHAGLEAFGGAPTPFAELADAALLRFRELLSIRDGASGYLAPLIALGNRDGGLTIATLNFDLTVEECARSVSVKCETGMETWVVYGTWMWEEDGLRLLKLHGSISEAWDEVEHFDGLMPHQSLYEVDDPAQEQHSPVVVFGTRGKLEAKGPFLSLLAQFELFLRSAEQLVVIGYSFRDAHVNEAIVRWSHFSTGRKLVVVDPGWPQDAGVLHKDDFRSILVRHLLPPPDEPHRFEPRLQIHREPCSAALQGLLGSA